MTKKRITTDGDEKLKAALDAGNGEVSGISNETQYPIGFEPIIAPYSKGRGINKGDERPTYSLKVDGQKLVFGVNDVFEHGKVDELRRQSGTTRYTGADYFNLIDVMLLNLFAKHRGTPDRISPTLTINLPIVEYNKDGENATVEEVRATLLSNGGKRDIADYENCVLQVLIDPKRLFILPESAGALFHYAFDEKTLERRPGASLTGSSIVCDIGYETTDMSLFEGTKYRRNRATTLERAGMGNITRAISDYLISGGVARSADVSRIDRALRPFAGKRPDIEQYINLPTGEYEIHEVYDQAVTDTAARISDHLLSYFTEGAQRVILAGGGTYHLKDHIKNHLEKHHLKVEICPTPEHANVWGAYSTLRTQEKR